MKNKKIFYGILATEILLILGIITIGFLIYKFGQESGIYTIGQAKEQLSNKLLNIDGVVGVGIGECGVQLCITVFLESDSVELKKQIPERFQGFSVRTEVTGPIEPFPPIAEKVTITTDKTEYEQGEPVNIALSHSDKPIYVEFPGVGEARYPFYRLKGNVWEKLATGCETNCIITCENGTLKEGPCAQYAPPLYYFSQYKGPWEGIQWNQKECIYETKLCGSKNYTKGSLKQVSAGKFKVEFCYFNKEDVDMSKPPGSATPDKKKCAEREFTVKEKSVAGEDKCDVGKGDWGGGVGIFTEDNPNLVVLKSQCEMKIDCVWKGLGGKIKSHFACCPKDWSTIKPEDWKIYGRCGIMID